MSRAKSSYASMQWYIYTLHDPREPAIVRYVGWTVEPKKRLWTHIYQAKSQDEQTYCAKWKRSLLAVGVEPVMTVIEAGVGDSWAEAEMKWIAYYRSNGKLTNLTAGGEGAPGHSPSSETREKMSAAGRGRKQSPESVKRRANANRGKTRSPEAKAKMRAAHLGKPLSPQHALNAAQAHRGLKLSDATRAKISAARRNRSLRKNLEA